MAKQARDLRKCATAYDCRDKLPELARWMSDDAMKLIPLWQGTRFERGKVYFDLDNPERGAFAATGDEGRPTDYTYTCMSDVPEEIWALLITWRQPVSERQGDVIASVQEHLHIPQEGSAAGDFKPEASRSSRR
jgi:hypothetical protein